MELRPEPGGGKPFVQGYGAGRFRIAGQVVIGSVLVLPGRFQPWPVGQAGDITVATLAPILAEASALDLLILGGGAAAVAVSEDLRGALRTAGVVVEAMDTGAACRTFNVLLAEDRRVAAALISI